MPGSRLLSSSWLPMAVTAVGVVTILFSTGTPVSATGMYFGYLVATVAFPGIWLWRMLLRSWHTEDQPPTWFEDATMGTIFGFGIQLPVYILGVVIGHALLFLALPVLVAMVSLLPAGRRVWTQPTGKLDVRASWALAAVTLYGLAYLARSVYPSRPLSLPLYEGPSVDETFHQALIAELMHRFPPQMPFLLGVPMDYHWFVHAQLAATVWATPLSAVILLRQLLPAALLTLTVLGVAVVVLRLTKRPLLAPVAPALLVAGGFYLMGPHFQAWNFDEPYISKRLVSSPSMTYGDTMALPAVLLTLDVLGRRAVPRLVWVTLLLTLLAVSGGKATFLPIFLCGGIAAWVVTFLRTRRIDRALTGVVVLTGLAAAFAQIVLYGGNSGGMSFSPFFTSEVATHVLGLPHTPSATVLMTCTLLVGWWLYGAGAVGLLRAGRWHDPRAVWLTISILAGTSVPLLLFRSGLVQMWFQRSTAILVVILSVWGLSYLLPAPASRRTVVRLGALAVTAGLVAFGISLALEPADPTYKGATYAELLATVLAPLVIVAGFVLVRMLFGDRGRAVPTATSLVVFLLGLGLMHVYGLGYKALTEPVDYERPQWPLFARGGVQAAKWLARHSKPDAIVATNVHCLRPHALRCDNRNFWVSAYTQRRIVVEGWGYTAPTYDHAVNGKASAFIPVPFPKRLAVNDAAFEFPTRHSVTRLVRKYDVSWLFVSKRYPVDVRALLHMPHLVEEKYAHPPYIIFKVRQWRRD